MVGASWPYQTNTLQADKAPVKDLIPSEGATGWLDTWMLASHARHPNCAYLWMRYISQSKVQAQQAISFGETPANRLACPYMDRIQKGRLRPVPRERARVVLQLDPVLAHSHHRLRQRADELHRLQRVAAEVD